jgi:predicted ATPase/DNA-binding SARP family transcriptional activator
MKRTVIRLLGPFGVSIDGEQVTAFKYAKVRALLAYLALESHQPHPRDQLAALLWPDQSEGAARASLSQALTTLRGALGDKAAGQPLVLSDALSVRLNPEAAVDVDVDQFLAALAAADAHPHHSWRVCAECAERLRRAVELYRGHFLADLAVADSANFEEWATLRREHLLQRALSALERLVERAQWRGAYGEAIAHAEQLVALEPLLEASQRALMRLLALNGEEKAALARYRHIQAALARELEAEPEEATRALFEQIRAGDLAGLRPSQPRFVAPALPTPLVGRAAELEAVCARVREPQARAVTITGAGGIGKTRLAVEAARALRHDFEDGVFVVELAALSDPALVVGAIARALGVKERPGQCISETLRDHLRAKHTLLVLDNFEHVVDAASDVSELLAACPALTTLVTSRTPLNIRAEQQFTLEPLADTDAVQLFLERAQAGGAAWAAEGGDTATYAAICRQLDRLPLAIELIAVRARTLPAAELLRQLDRPLQALTRSPRDAPPRHRALRNAIQWSYDLLDAETQRAFATLGVFAGGWSAEAAQAVLGPSCDALTVLETLHQASLVQMQPVADETRFSMLVTIREFALEQREAGEAAEGAASRHAEHFARFAMEAYVEILRADAPRWRTRVAAEQDNLRAAFRWAIGHEAYVPALQIATGVWRFNWMSGLLREGLERLEHALAYRDRAPLELQSQAMRAAGTLATGLNDYERSRHWLERAIASGRRLNDGKELQAALANLGYSLLEQGELEAARLPLEESLALARRLENTKVIKFPLGMLASLHMRLGHLATARALGEECLRINRACEDPEGVANALRTLAQVLLAQGDLRRALQLVQEALAWHRSLDHQFGIGLDYILLGDIDRAQGDNAAALEHYRRCLSLWRDRENIIDSAQVLEKVADLLARADDYGRASALLSAATALRERAGDSVSPTAQARLDETALICREALGEAAFADAWERGSRLTLAQAIDLASEPLRALHARRHSPAGRASPAAPRAEVVASG